MTVAQRDAAYELNAGIDDLAHPLGGEHLAGNALVDDVLASPSRAVGYTMRRAA